jgi:hypothetical protein
MGTRHEEWPEHVVEGAVDVLGETDTGLSGSEIARLLERSKIRDVEPDATKRHRLREALVARQAKDGAANCIILFITVAMEPVRYLDNPGLFTQRQGDLNEVLVFIGLRVDDQGKLARGAKAQTLSEAAQHANSLRAELR